MNIYFIVCLLLIMGEVCFASNNIKFKDGFVFFPKYEFKGNKIYTEEEKKNIDDKNNIFYSTTPRPSIYSPDQFEYSVSTCIGKFKNSSDYYYCLTKEGLFQKILEMQQKYNLLEEIGISDTENLKDRISFLKQLYKNKYGVN